MKIGLSENFTAKVTNALKESENTKKTMKEDSYDETFFSDIEDALRNAGFDVTRFTDAGILTKNLGWVVENSEGEVQLSCDGTWLDESLKEMEFPPKEEKEVTRDELLKKKEELKREYFEAQNKHDKYWPSLVAEDITKINRLIDGSEKEAIIGRIKYKLKEAEDFVIDPFDKVGGDVKYILDGIDKLRKGLHSYESEKILDTILERVPEILKELGYSWGNTKNESIKESIDLTEEGFDTFNGFKNELRKNSGLYGLISNEAHNMSTELLKEVALDGIYYAEGHEEDIVRDIKERYYDDIS